MAKDVKKLEQELDSVNSHLSLLRGEFVKERGSFFDFQDVDLQGIIPN